MPDKSVWQTLIDIFASPNEALAAIRERPRYLVPLLLVIAFSAIASGLYLAEVDVGWLTEESLRAVRIVQLTDAQIEQFAAVAAERGNTRVLIQGVLSTGIFITLLNLLVALYLRIVSAFTKDGVRYRQWFSLSCWTGMPAIFGAIATAIFVLSNDVSFVSQTAINPISFANLSGMDLSDSSLSYRTLMNLSPVNVWSLVLLILGHRCFAQKGLLFAGAIVLVPLVFLGAVGVALN